MENRVSNKQLEILLDFLLKNPDVVKGIGLGSRSKDNLDNKWKDLAKKLNCFGSSKTGERWKKYWADLKHKSKCRLVKYKRDTSGTCHLSQLDKKVIEIIGKQRVHKENSVPEFDTEPVESDGIMFSQEVVIPHNVTETIPLSSPAPREKCTLYSSEFQEPVKTKIESEDPLHTGRESPVIRTTKRKRRSSSSSMSDVTNPTRLDAEWIMNLEKTRVEAEKKMADAAMVMADAAMVMAEASRTQAEMARTYIDITRQIVEVVRRQSDDIHMLIDSRRNHSNRLTPVSDHDY